MERMNRKSKICRSLAFILALVLVLQFLPVTDVEIAHAEGAIAEFTINVNGDELVDGATVKVMNASDEEKYSGTVTEGKVVIENTIVDGETYKVTVTQNGFKRYSGSFAVSGMEHTIAVTELYLKVTGEVAGDGGNISLELGDGTPITDSGVKYNSSVKVKVESANTFKIKELNVDDINKTSEINNNVYTTETLQKDCEIVATFQSTLPVIEMDEGVANPENWSKEGQELTGVVKDSSGSCIEGAKIYMFENEQDSIAPDDMPSEAVNIATTNADGGFSYEFLPNEDINNKNYYLYAIVDGVDDKVVSEKQVISVKIDVTVPEVKTIKYNSSECKYLDDYTLNADEFNVKIEGKDASSGIKEYELYIDGEENPIVSQQGEFELEADTFSEPKEIYFKIIDNAGNKSGIIEPTFNSEIYSSKVWINNASAKVKITPSNVVYENTEEQTNYWYSSNENIVCAVDLSVEEQMTLDSMRVKINDSQVELDGWDGKFEAEVTEASKEIILPAENIKEGINKVEFLVKTKNGREVSKKVNICIDKTAGEVKGENGQGFNFYVTKNEKQIYTNDLSFGSFANEYVTVKVKAADVATGSAITEDTSGVKNVILYSGTAENIKDVDRMLASATEKDGYFTFTIPKSVLGADGTYFNSPIYVIVVDNVGNISKTFTPNSTNSNMKFNQLMIETNQPYANITTDGSESKVDGDLWFGKDTELTVEAKDPNSGINNVSIVINEVEVKSWVPEEEDHEEILKINTNTVSANKDGSYNISVKVVDNAGNVKEETKTIYIDTKNPKITDYSFSPKGIQESKGDDLSVDITDYGFYFTKDTKVTITADDESPSSQVKSITYYLVDKDTGKTKENTVNVNANNKISFTVKANFKGQIYAKATDNVGHTPEKYVNPDGSVIESPAKHKQETHIELKTPTTYYEDKNGIELYKKDTNVKITVKDTYSGIKKIEWSVKAPYDKENNQSGSLELLNDKSYKEGSNSSGWEKTKTEKNIVTQMTKTLTVKNNSNEIIVNVKMTDRAGNVTETPIVFSIDKTNPKIEVTYDNNADDTDNKDYYKEDRTATIEITERNFSEDDVIYAITNSDGVVPKISAWKTIENKENPDATIHRATITYTADGDYTFDISYEDNADNKAPAVAQHEFTMDQTLPLVEVNYNEDESRALNNNYYSRDRLATITIREHNFDASRVTVISEATDDGVTSTFPEISNWTTDGDTHTATIPYTEDGLYKFDIEYMDMAGNESEDYMEDEFYVDKTKPELKITGVENKSANKKKQIVPVITYSDTNYDVTDGLKIELSAVNQNELKIYGEFTEITNGRIFTFKNMGEDDIYTLKATAIDYAGNKTSKLITYSVNREGSVYNLDNLETINGKYVQEEVEIVFTETNVDELKEDTIQLKMTKNGMPMDLKLKDPITKEGDYVIEPEANNGKNQWYKYTYKIDQELFKGDGRYTVAVYSEDAAGNKNENTEMEKKAEISFGIDKTAPVIVPIDFESDTQYAVEQKAVTVSVKDNLVLENVKLYVNGKEEKYTSEGEDYKFNIASSNSLQDVEIIADDAAGNSYTLAINDVLVSTNLFVRWFNNTPLFIGSIAGITILGLAIAIYFLFGRKKKQIKTVE